MRRTLFILASIVVSGIFLWLALRDVPQQDILASLQQADLGWILVSLGFVTAGLWTRAIRWRGLLGNRVATMQAFHMLNIAMLLNQLPLRAGEVARSVLAMRSGVSFITAATSILVERLLDVLLVVIWLALALTQLPDVPPEMSNAAALFGIAGVIALVMLVVFARRPQLARNLLAFFERFLPFLKRLPLHNLVENVLEGIKPLAHWRSAAHAIGWTIISWTLSLGTFYALARALNIDTDIFLMSVLSVTLASFAIAIPVSVASIGPFEGAVRLSGDAVGLSAAQSLSLGFLFHGINILGYAIWGTIGLVVMGVSLSELVRSSEKADSPAETTASAGAK
ncbi:MAG: flippase-like domain-containing protein [Anaerolineae bacterium]|nr:flippase-like domain-containing protein [Anaerolineae bacterium]